MKIHQKSKVLTSLEITTFQYKAFHYMNIVILRCNVTVIKSILCIYCSRLAQNVQERCLRVCYDKNECKRAQEHDETRSGAGEPSLLLRSLAYIQYIYYGIL